MKNALDKYLTAEDIGWIMELKRDRNALRTKWKHLSEDEQQAATELLKSLSNAAIAEKFEVPEWVIEKV